SGVRPDQAALAELRPAVVPGHDDRDVADTAVEQDGEHRPPGRAVGLAVIAHPDLARGAGRPDDVRPAVVRRVRELGPDIGDEGPRRLDRRRSADRRDETAAFDLLLDPVATGRDEI